MLVYDSIERETIPPGGREVSHIHITVASCLHLAPEKQGILSSPGSLVLFRDHRDVLDLEPKQILVEI